MKLNRIILTALRPVGRVSPQGVTRLSACADAGLRCANPSHGVARLAVLAVGIQAGIQEIEGMLA